MSIFSGRTPSANIGRLIKQLDHDNQSTRLKAGGDLVKLGSEGVIPLLKAIAGSKVKDKKLAGQVLVRIGQAAIPELNNLLSREKNTPLHPIATELLGRIQHPDAVGVLGIAIKNPDYKIRCKAARALSFHKNPKAISLLHNALKDPDPDVRIAAVAPLAHLAGQKSILWLADLLEDPELGVRHEAALYLGKLGEDALPYLVEELKDPFWWYDRADAAKVLLDGIRENGTAAVPFLIDALAFPEPIVRQFAIQILAELQDSRALERLEMALYDPHFGVGADAALALALFGPEGIKSLLGALNNREGVIRQNTVTALGKSGHRSVVPQVIDMLNDPEQIVREQAILALQNLGDPRAIPVLQSIVQDPQTKHNRLRVLAREALDTFSPTLKSGNNPEELPY